MTDSDVAIAVLRDAYPRQDFPDRTVVLYAEMLADLPGDEVVAAVKRLIRRSPFLPSVAEIRREVAEEVLNLPTPAEAWRMVNDAATQNLLEDEVSEAMQFVGGRYAIRTSDRPEVLRAQFLKCYENLREQALLEEMVAEPSVPTLRAVAEIPETTSMPASPLADRVWRRAEAADAGGELPPATDEEKRDAIRVLRLGEPPEGDDAGYLVWREAHRIMDDETKRQTCGHDGWVAGCVHCETESALANTWIERAERGETKA